MRVGLPIYAAGLVQTMVAAGLTRAGRSVLHIDKYVTIVADIQLLEEGVVLGLALGL